MELTFKEPEIITVPEIDEEGNKIIKKYEIIPLDVEEMKLTVVFQELQLQLDEFTYTKQDLQNQVNDLMKTIKENPSKNKSVIKKRGNQLRKLTKDLRQASLDREKFVIGELLPTLVKVVDKGLVDYDTGERVSLHPRHKTLPKMMAIAVKILDMTTETDRDVDTNFQIEEPQKKDSEQSEQE